MRTPLMLACLLLAACSQPAPPSAGTAAAADATDTTDNAIAREAARHHELKDAVEARDYRDKAKAAGDATLEADKKHDEELKAAGG
jgi:hypothetical protein